MKPDSALKPLRRSASLILTFSDQGVDAHRVLMLNRKPHMSFAKALVFPGGVCEQADSKYVESKQFEQFAKITAIRELVQETKILLLPPCVNKEQIGTIKSLFINHGQSKFIDQISKIWSKNLHLLLPVARFVTPQFPKMSRYDCIFYIVQERMIRLNLGGSDSFEHLNIQKEQASQYFWKQPEQYLKLYNERSHYLPPPQNIILNVLMRIGAKNPLHYSKLLAKNLLIQPFLANFQNRTEFLLVGDQSYNSSNVFKQEPQSKSKKQVTEFIVKLGNNTKKVTKRRIHSLNNSNIMYNYDGLVQQQTILQYLQTFVPDSSL